MSSQNNNDIAEAEAQHEQAFGEFVYMSENLRENINWVKNDNPNYKHFRMVADDVASLSELAWQLLGRYIANNTHLDVIQLTKCGLTDNHLSLLFRELVRSESITDIDLSNFNPTIHDAHFNQVGLVGIQSMVPFLQNSPKLSEINLNWLNTIGGEPFDALINALDGGPTEELHLRRCSMTDISVLGNVTLPCLKKIDLKGNNTRMSNNIGIDGCRTIANLLRNDDSRLETLNLDNTGIDNISDEGVELLVNSLKNNTTLRILYLRWNVINRRGYQSILKMLIDVSSIENTYTSNHTLEELFLPDHLSSRHINFALSKNRHYHHAGKQKIIHYQFNHLNRTELATLQGITPPTHNSVYVQIDPVVLPDVLAMIGGNCTHSDMYLALTTTASDLTSLINKPAVFKERMEQNERKAAALTAEYEREAAALKAKHESKLAVLTAKNLKMKEELAELLQSDEQKNQARGTKRDRS